MKTALDLEPPSFDEPPEPADPFETALAPGSDVFVELGGALYEGKVSRASYFANGEVAVETPAAQHMSRHWKTLLFYIQSRKAVYGIATLIIPGIDPVPQQPEIKRTYETKPQEPAPLDEPEALARENDVGDQWHEASTLEDEEQKELWYQRD